MRVVWPCHLFERRLKKFYHCGHRVLEGLSGLFGSSHFFDLVGLL